MRLIYDDNDITAINLTNNNMTVAGLNFNGLDGAAAFRAADVAGTLNVGDCIQLWSIARNQPKEIEGCDGTISWRSTQNTAIHFWTQVSSVQRFQVVEDGIERAICEAAPPASQDSPKTCEFYIAGGSSGSSDLTPYIYLAYTRDAIIFHNNSLDKWMITNQTTFVNNNPQLATPGVSLVFGDTNLLGDDFRVGLGDITRLAPQQCIMFTLEGSDVSSPPEECALIARRALAPDIAFWVADFGVQSSTDGRERTCPAALPNRMTLCILPR
jgi:hypothetical protein